MLEYSACVVRIRSPGLKRSAENRRRLRVNRLEFSDSRHRRLVAAAERLRLQIVNHRVHNHRWLQTRAGFVEMVDEGAARCLATNGIDVNAHGGSVATHCEMRVAHEVRPFINRGDAPLEH